jgi:uncharacterized protein HemX
MAVEAYEEAPKTYKGQTVSLQEVADGDTRNVVGAIVAGAVTLGTTVYAGVKKKQAAEQAEIRGEAAEQAARQRNRLRQLASATLPEAPGDSSSTLLILLVVLFFAGGGYLVYKKVNG